MARASQQSPKACFKLKASRQRRQRVSLRVWFQLSPKAVAATFRTLLDRGLQARSGQTPSFLKFQTASLNYCTNAQTKYSTKGFLQGARCSSILIWALHGRCVLQCLCRLLRCHALQAEDVVDDQLHIMADGAW